MPWKMLMHSDLSQFEASSTTLNEVASAAPTAEGV